MWAIAKVIHLAYTTHLGSSLAQAAFAAFDEGASPNSRLSYLYFLNLKESGDDLCSHGFEKAFVKPCLFIKKKEDFRLLHEEKDYSWKLQREIYFPFALSRKVN